MTKALARDPIYRRRRFPPDIIELCVRWYITYRLSYRDLVAMMAEREIHVSHSTVLRWVLRYVPEFEKRWARYAKPVNSSWRMDETAVVVGGQHRYLYRAVDKRGASVDYLLCTDRSRDSAQAFFRKAVTTHSGQWPRTVNLDGNAASHRALRLLGQEDPRWRSVIVRGRRYLNNIVEQDHRAIKRRCASMLGFKSFRTAAITLAGIELAHRIHKRQFVFGSACRFTASSLKQLWDAVLGGVNEPRCAPTHQAPPRSTANAPELNSGQQRSPSGLKQRASLVQTTRRPRKIFYGGGLYLLVVPVGSRRWRYKYRFDGKEKALALGVFPDVSPRVARLRHQAARRLLADGIDPSLRRRELRSAAAAANVTPP